MVDPKKLVPGAVVRLKPVTIAVNDHEPHLSLRVKGLDSKSSSSSWIDASAVEDIISTPAHEWKVGDRAFRENRYGTVRGVCKDRLWVEVDGTPGPTTSHVNQWTPL